MVLRMCVSHFSVEESSPPTLLQCLCLGESCLHGPSNINGQIAPNKLPHPAMHYMESLRLLTYAEQFAEPVKSRLSVGKLGWRNFLRPFKVTCFNILAVLARYSGLQSCQKSGKVKKRLTEQRVKPGEAWNSVHRNCKYPLRPSKTCYKR